jgi:diadenosine tetraphosphate (Ap4A) HIT family hydrolase
MSECPLCVPASTEVLLWRDADCRVIDVGDAAYPGYCRAIWNEHVREMSDLVSARRDSLMHVVYAVEQSLRALLQPDKINLVSLGNQVPHLHWHIIPRFSDDPHFPDAIWAARRRPGATRHLAHATLRQELERRLGKTS